MSNDSTDQLLESAQKDIGYRFKDPKLLLKALTHKSFSNENRLNYNNERLEYLGDSILDFIIAYTLYEGFPEGDEGMLSQMRAVLVNKKELSNIARKINLNKYILLGKGEQLTTGRDKDSILSDAYEAIIGAIFLDSNIRRVTNVIKRHFLERVKSINTKIMLQDYKTAILIYCQEHYKKLPAYELVSQTGPDHKRIFEVRVIINGEEYGRGRGSTKKEAEQQAAKVAIEKITNRDNEK